MFGKAVLVFSRDRQGTRALIRRLRAAGNDVARTHRADAVGELIAAGAVDLLVVDAGNPAELARVIDLAGRRVPVVAVAGHTTPAAVLDLICEHPLQHLVSVAGAAGDDDGSPLQRADQHELVVTVEKLLRRDLFGLDKYLPAFGVEFADCDVLDPEHRGDVADIVQRYVAALGAPRRLSALIAEVADELVGNALVHGPGNAPAEREGQRGAFRPVGVRFASDGRTFGLAVQDAWGTLKPEHVRSALRHYRVPADPLTAILGPRTFGLYTALTSSNQLVFNIDPGRRTEVIALFDLAGGVRAVRDGRRSVHVFCHRDRGAIPEPVPVGAATSRSVVLSESMRLDLRRELGSTPEADLRSLAGGAMPLLVPKRQPPRRLPTWERLGIEHSPYDSIGLDTARGLLRGTRELQFGVETALRYLTSDHLAAVAFRVEDGALRPYLSAGNVYDLHALGAIEVPLLGEGQAPGERLPTLLEATADSRLRALRPWRHGSDRALIEAVCGRLDAPGFAIPILAAGCARFVLCAFQPRAARIVELPALAAVRRELEQAVERIDPPYEAFDLEVPAPERPSTVPPYDIVIEYC